MIETDRLLIRPWRDAEVEPFHAMNQDPEVVRYLGPPITLDQARAAKERMDARHAKDGYCFWALERRADQAFIGFCGLLPAKPPIASEIEIGWRLRRDAWGRGYAREAAEACLAWGWATLDAPAIAAITVPANRRSWGLIVRLGMRRVPGGDFDHPDLPEGDPLRRHILYRIGRLAA